MVLPKANFNQLLGMNWKGKERDKKTKKREWKKVGKTAEEDPWTVLSMHVLTTVQLWFNDPYTPRNRIDPQWQLCPPPVLARRVANNVTYDSCTLPECFWLHLQTSTFRREMKIWRVWYLFRPGWDLPRHMQAGPGIIKWRQNWRWPTDFVVQDFFSELSVPNR
jgi:hypothetical protein